MTFSAGDDDMEGWASLRTSDAYVSNQLVTSTNLRPMVVRFDLRSPQEAAMRLTELARLSEHLAWLSAHTDPPEELRQIIDVKAFRLLLVRALTYASV